VRRQNTIFKNTVFSLEQPYFDYFKVYYMMTIFLIMFCLFTLEVGTRSCPLLSDAVRREKGLPMWPTCTVAGARLS
jgi:hypothetical protein